MSSESLKTWRTDRSHSCKDHKEMTVENKFSLLRYRITNKLGGQFASECQ